MMTKAQSFPLLGNFTILVGCFRKIVSSFHNQKCIGEEEANDELDMAFCPDFGKKEGFC
jgi:hypothetical protein